MVDQAHRNERGESLIELLVAVLILGVAIAAIVGGLGTSILMSDVHRKQAAIGAHVRAYAAAIDRLVARYPDTGYVNCAGLDTVAYASAYATGDANFVPSLAEVRYWKPDTKSFSTDRAACNADGDSGVQMVSVRVSSSDGRAAETMNVIIRRPCRTGETPACTA